MNGLVSISFFALIVGLAFSNASNAKLRVTAPLESELTGFDLREGEIFVHESSNSLYWHRSGLDAPIAPATPAGIISAYGGASAPTGYLLCNGAAVSRTTYANLFAVIGTAFGEGDGSTTFNVPDLRGRFLRGVDGTATRDPDATARTAMNVGGNLGNAVGSVQNDDFKSHTHNWITSYTGSGQHPGRQSNAFHSSNDMADVTTATGGNETRPKNANVNYIIKI